MPALGGAPNGEIEAIPIGEIDPARGHLRPGDVIRLKFPYQPELDQKLPVQPDGTITLPYTGRIDAVTVTRDELAEVIRTRAGDRLRNPQVEIILAESAEQRVYVGGEVRNPGFVIYRHGMTPLEAITDRGGFTDTARVDYVVHLVAQPQQYLATRIDLSPQGESKGPRLAANDILYVPRNTIGDMNAFMRIYIESFLPFPPLVGTGFHDPGLR